MLFCFITYPVLVMTSVKTVRCLICSGVSFLLVYLQYGQFHISGTIEHEVFGINETTVFEYIENFISSIKTIIYRIILNINNLKLHILYLCPHQSTRNTKISFSLKFHQTLIHYNGSNQ